MRNVVWEEKGVKSVNKIQEALGISKINNICDVLKVEIEKKNNDQDEKNKYLLTLLTIYVKKQPQEIKQALDLIREMQKEEKKSKEAQLKVKMIPPHLNPITLKKYEDTGTVIGAREALAYISWLVNANKLYDVALTTYDFELVTLVASQTQKDPKEYVPYL